jgi:serine/threonine-protein kinase HipA
MTTLNIKEKVDVCLGQAGIPVGSLVYTKQGRRENTAFAYSAEWLANPEQFKVSSDLELIADYQLRKAPSQADSPFPFALADTAPDAWGRRVILRDNAKRRKKDAKLRELTELDFLLAVDDFSRIGALRLRDGEDTFHRTVEAGRRATPPLVDLGKMYDASRAVEAGKETEQDLRYLLGKGTSLGGMRPKCTVVDQNGMLAIGKFPSINDTRSITRGEVLALRLAGAAGIDAAQARIEVTDGVAIALIERFDRTLEGGRIPYMSAASMLQASRQDEHSYAEIADAIRANSQRPTEDAQQLWRRIVFNHFITNVDDHLQNHGFLHCGHGLWRLAPAFDINPFPDKDRESKTWLSEGEGPVVALAPLLANCAYFSLRNDQALQALAKIYKAVKGWRAMALSADVGLTAAELDDFAPAFDHEVLEEARAALGGEPA